MMYTKTSPDQIEFQDKVGDDEPIFILRARDVLSPHVIQYWIDRAVSSGVNSDKIGEAYKHMQAFITWQQNNNTKLPD